MLEPETEKVRTLEQVLESEKEKPSKGRSMCLRSSARGRARKKKETRKRRARTQNMIEEGLRYLDESDPESIEDACLLLGLTRDVIDLD